MVGGGGGGGPGLLIRPDTCLRLKSLQRQDCMSLFNWLNFFMKRVSYFATKLTSSDIQKRDCLWVPSYDLFALLAKQYSRANGDWLSQIEKHIVVSAFSLTSGRGLGKSKLPQKSSTVLSEPKFGPSPTPMKNSCISPCKDVTLSSEPIKAYAGACK